MNNSFFKINHKPPKKFHLRLSMDNYKLHPQLDVKKYKDSVLSTALQHGTRGSSHCGKAIKKNKRHLD